jgi:hypothetical protein
LGTGIAIWNIAGCEDLVCELGAGFEGQLLGEDERIIAVKEEGGDLLGYKSRGWKMGDRRVLTLVILTA